MLQTRVHGEKKKHLASSCNCSFCFLLPFLLAGSMVRHSARVRLQPCSSVDGPIAAPSPVHGRPVQRSIRLPAMFVHADLRSLLPQPFLPVAVFIPQIEYSFSTVAAMLHAVRTEEDVDKLVMRLILLNAPKARVGKKTFFCRLQIAFSLAGICLGGHHDVLPCQHGGRSRGEVPQKKPLTLKAQVH